MVRLNQKEELQFVGTVCLIFLMGVGLMILGIVSKALEPGKIGLICFFVAWLSGITWFFCSISEEITKEDTQEMIKKLPKIELGRELTAEDYKKLLYESYENIAELEAWIEERYLYWDRDKQEAFDELQLQKMRAKEPKYRDKNQHSDFMDFFAHFLTELGELFQALFNPEHSVVDVAKELADLVNMERWMFQKLNLTEAELSDITKNSPG